jgi:protein-S-isoprenylcysteine O-methyltransferase Ste14
LKSTTVRFLLFLGVQVVAVLILLVLMAGWPGPWNPQRMVGSALLLIGMLLVFTARLQLGQSFSITPQAKQLVTGGLYSKIRNPIYLFGMVAIVGLCLILQRRGLWIMVPVILAMQIVRARKESQVLEAKFGDEYRAYRSRTWL